MQRSVPDLPSWMRILLSFSADFADRRPICRQHVTVTVHVPTVITAPSYLNRLTYNVYYLQGGQTREATFLITHIFKTLNQLTKNQYKKLSCC